MQFERVLYSVPFTLVGKRLWLRATDTTVTIFEDLRLVATHARARRPGERVTLSDHLPPEAQAFFAHDRSWCLTQARAIGPAPAELIERLLADPLLERLRAAQALLRLVERYGAARLEAACARALYHASPLYRTVKTILASGLDTQPLPAAASLATGVYAAQARFARDATELFDVPAFH